MGMRKNDGARFRCLTDDSDLEDVYNTERHLLYVACTRARDHLMVSGVDPCSEFLDDLGLYPTANIAVREIALASVLEGEPSRSSERPLRARAQIA